MRLDFGVFPALLRPPHFDRPFARASRFVENQRLDFLLDFLAIILGNLREIGVDHFPALDRDVVFFVFHCLLPFDLFDFHCLPVQSI